MKPIDVTGLAKFDTQRHRKIELLRSPTFNAVQICFEAGQEISPHVEPYAVLFYVIDGEGMITTDDGSWTVGSGDMIFVQKDAVRGIAAKTRMRILGIQELH
jgi:quercetin dioxygenase-like cupin family protein